ncbi:hypothetical protein H4K35_14320 [Myroides sp. NP-2]|uniref:hypothetical protein n=1 Tax=Myroides sp. NP-2 TaxID=2759945 RepID=UPI0015F7F1A1|nr:hypothetical protein [Myroides sp. NP-2]MBB1151259.1 hypothetical protein [Myroides sp. NP-2]
MKVFRKVLLFLVLMFGCFVNAQTVNDIPLKELDVEYILIVGEGKMFSDKVSVKIDFGQNTKFFSSKDEMFIRDKEGERVKFNSMVDALNYLSGHGFQFVQAYAITIGNQNVYHYLMRKENDIERLTRETRETNKDN